MKRYIQYWFIALCLFVGCSGNGQRTRCYTAASGQVCVTVSFEAEDEDTVYIHISTNPASSIRSVTAYQYDASGNLLQDNDITGSGPIDIHEDASHVSVTVEMSDGQLLEFVQQV